MNWERTGSVSMWANRCVMIFHLAHCTWSALGVLLEFIGSAMGVHKEYSEVNSPE